MPPSLQTTLAAKANLPEGKFTALVPHIGEMKVGLCNLHAISVSVSLFSTIE
jgi:hypothetical protein